MGQGDDMAALDNAQYTCPRGAISFSHPSHLLKNQMSEASRLPENPCWVRADDIVETVSLYCPRNIVQPPKESTLLWF
jgi:hypothetical protein